MEEKIPDLNTYDAMLKYFRARLAGDTVSAPPHISLDHDVGYEDILISKYSNETFSTKQQKWFWKALRQTITHAWKNSDQLIFRRCISIARRLEKPLDYQEWLDFLPLNANDYQWDKKERRIIGADALRLFVSWDIVSDKDFWETNFKLLLRYLPDDIDVQEPLLRIYEGIGSLDRPQWQLLLQFADKAENYPTLLVREILFDQWFACNEDRQKENALLIEIGTAFSLAKAECKEFRHIKEIEQVIDDWCDLPWVDDIKQLLDKFHESAHSQEDSVKNPRSLVTTHYQNECQGNLQLAPL